MTIIKKTDTTSSINSKLSKGGKVRFCKGIYKITDALILPSGIEVDLNGSTLRRYSSTYVFRAEVSPDTTGYSGAHDIVIKNGTIEGMNSRGYSPSPLTSFMHCKNLKLQELTFLDSVGEHSIDLIGCEGVEIICCSFLGHKRYEKLYKEAIQIDFAWSRGCAIFNASAKAYDLTHCSNILIDGCSFGASKTYPANNVAIGTHTMASSQCHKDIKVTNCCAVGNGNREAINTFFRQINMKNVSLLDNSIMDYNSTIRIEEPSKVYAGNGKRKAHRAKLISEV